MEEQLNSTVLCSSSTSCRVEESKRESTERNGMRCRVPHPKSEQIHVSRGHCSLLGKNTSSILSSNYSYVIVVQLSILTPNYK